jgi:hypothetical protein
MTDAQFAFAIATSGAIVALLLYKGYRMISKLKEKIAILRGVVTGLKSERDVLRSDLDAARTRIADLEQALKELPEAEAIADEIIALLNVAPAEPSVDRVEAAA